MTTSSDTILELARSFAQRGFSPDVLGAQVWAGPSRIALRPHPHTGLVVAELELHEGELFALHLELATPIAMAFDAWEAALGPPTELARDLPRDPIPYRFSITATDYTALVVVEVDRRTQPRATGVQLYRFASRSLAGAYLNDEHVLALVELVLRADFTLAAAHAQFGPTQETTDSLISLRPRPGANLTRADLELFQGEIGGIRLAFEHPLALDFGRLRDAFGAERSMITGNPPSFRTTYSFGARGADHAGQLMLSTYTREVGDRRSIESLIVRRTMVSADSDAQERDSREVTIPVARRAVDAPLAPERIVSLIDAFFEHALDTAGALRLLGDPEVDGGRRVRLIPQLPGIAGCVLVVDGDELQAIELELAEGSALEPAALERRFGAGQAIAPLHAHAATAQRFHCRGATHHGFVAVDRDRVALRRLPLDAWLGDFAHGENLIELIGRYLANPRLDPEEVYQLVGHPEPEIEIGDDDRSVGIVPFAGSNLERARLCYHPSKRTITRLELGPRHPWTVDFRSLAPWAAHTHGPSPGLLDMKIIQYKLECPTPEFVGMVLLNTADRRAMPVQLVTSVILAKVFPGDKNVFTSSLPGPDHAIDGMASALFR